MERGWLALLALAGAAVAAAASGGELSPGSVETGKRMYRDGVRSSGAALDGRVAGDVSLRGTQSSCAGCHGRSGLGGGEGGTLVPAITAGALFRPSDAWRFDPRGPAAGSRVPRPAYDARSLAKLLREGIDPSGRPLGPLMPRYALEDDDVAHLVAYLRTLSEAPSPGVTDQSLRFATVVAGDVDPAERSAMLDVLSAFFRARNAETRGESVRRQRGSWDHAPSFDAYRHWELEVWELDGPPQSWRAELDARYEAGPVFATIAGLADGEWLPIHQFCEARELPCVLPVTRLAPERDADFYSIYFSGGVRLEANVLARHLAESGQLGRKVVQVHGDGPEMRAAARRFEEAFRAKGGRVVSHRLPSEGGAEFWTGLVLGEGPEILVAWLPAGALTGLARAAPSSSVPLFASASFCEPADVPEALVARTRLVEPHALAAQKRRSRAALGRWLAKSGLPARAPRVEADTYFAATLVGRAIKHVHGSFSRDYFVETLEHQIETSTTPSLHPSLGLGRGQRFASKGAWITRITEQGELSAVSPWLTP